MARPRPIGLSKARAARARSQLLEAEELLREYRADQAYRSTAMRHIGERSLASFHDHRVHDADVTLVALAQLREDLQLPASMAQFLVPDFTAPTRSVAVAATSSTTAGPATH